MTNRPEAWSLPGPHPLCPGPRRSWWLCLLLRKKTREPRFSVWPSAPAPEALTNSMWMWMWVPNIRPGRLTMPGGPGVTMQGSVRRPSSPRWSACHWRRYPAPSQPTCPLGDTHRPGSPEEVCPPSARPERGSHSFTGGRAGVGRGPSLALSPSGPLSFHTPAGRPPRGWAGWCGPRERGGEVKLTRGQGRRLNSDSTRDLQQ